MPINTELLIAAPMLQDYFVDKTTGFPLAAGIVTLYQDNARNILKNWYYQSGTPGAYTYIPLPNPLTLSSVGTIQDAPNGNDVIPFFYPFDETDSTPQPYYITVVNSNLQAQFTRENFPFIANDFPQPSNVPTLRNYIANNVFYHNVGTLAVSAIAITVLAPSQHDGLMAANGNDIKFLKNPLGATDLITFTKFPSGINPLIGDITPEYYLNFNCSVPLIGETIKGILIPITLHLKTLDEVRYTFTFWAQNVSPNANNQILIRLNQFYGSGAVSGNQFIDLETITLTDSWTKYIIERVTPPLTGVVSNTGDDCLRILIQYPLGVTCNINIAKPSFYLGNVVPTNDFETYDQIDTIINSPRTGDFRLSLNSFSPFGWVPCNDGTIANNDVFITPPAGIPLTRSNQDTWQLFFLIWTFVGSTYAPMYDSAGNPLGGYGVSALSDWQANNQISLTKTLGRALASVGIPSAGGTLTNWALGQTFGEENHIQNTNEMPAHNHPGSLVAVGTGISTNTVGNNGVANTGAAPLSIATEGLGLPFNVIQPTLHVNVFLKL